MLDESDLDALDSYLSSDDSPDDCMMLSDLDGFLHGVVCSPSLIPTEEWFVRAMGSPKEQIPVWVVETVEQLHNSISVDINAKPPIVFPLFWETDTSYVVAMDWCEGFMEAVSMRPKEWLRLTESGSHGHFMTPIMTHLFDDEGNPVLGTPLFQLQDALDAAANAIPDAVAGIYLFWKLHNNPKQTH